MAEHRVRVLNLTTGALTKSTFALNAVRQRLGSNIRLWSRRHHSNYKKGRYCCDMESRTRGRRADRAPPAVAAAPVRRATRSTRQISASDIPPAPRVLTQPEVKQSKVQLPKASSEHSRGSIVSNPIPRRGARVSSSAASVVSIATNPPKAEEASDDKDEDEDEDEIAENESSAPVANMQEDDNSDEDDEDTERQIMSHNLLDLYKTANDLIKRLQHIDPNSRIFLAILQKKRSAFILNRDIFESSKAPAPYVDWAWLDKLDKSAEFAKAGKTILAFANLVTTIDAVESLRSGADIDPLPFLEQLDAAFPQLLIHPDSNNYNNGYSDLALGIRTVRLVETLAATKTNADPRNVIASVFCTPTTDRKKKDYAKLFSHGPFKNLGGQSNDLQDEQCADRIKEALLAIHHDRSTFGVAQLRAKFPLSDVLDNLREWLLNMHSAVAPRLDQIREQWRFFRLEPELFLDAEEDLAESVIESMEGSQHNIRHATTEVRARSLFVNEESLMQLTRSRHAAPPSNQQRTTPRSARQSINEEEDDDDDEFETDTRPLNSNKRAAMEAAFPPVKRQRFVPQSPDPFASPSSAHMPPPPLPNHAGSSFDPFQDQQSQNSTPPTSTHATLSAIAQEKAIVMQNARHQKAPATVKQRQAWNDRDAAVLVNLIEKRRAAWAMIEKEHSAEFQHPRNQQAYRDKARNMKVDFLITDHPLPPCFDLIALGKKEIERLSSLGKNPFRKEMDLDENGRPINTDLPYCSDENDEQQRDERED